MYKDYEKKIILGTSDAGLTSHLSQQTSEPAYYIVDCWIFSFLMVFRCPGAQHHIKNITLLQMTAQLSNVDCHAEFVFALQECQKNTK